MSDTPEADALEGADRYKIEQIGFDNPPYDRMHQLAQKLERERNEARQQAEELRNSLIRPEGPQSTHFPLQLEAPCCPPSVVYVVASGDVRVALECSAKRQIEDVCLEAIDRFVSMGCPPLGQLMEVTECSDDGDPSNPCYVSTKLMLKKAGRLENA